VQRQPSLVRASWESSLRPRLTNLQQELALSLTELKKVVLASPIILAYSFEHNTRPTLRTLADELVRSHN
jgi:hypothetical protein